MWIQLFKILLNLLQHCTVYCIDVQIEEPYLRMTPGGECKECQHTVNHCTAGRSMCPRCVVSAWTYLYRSDISTLLCDLGFLIGSIYITPVPL